MSSATVPRDERRHERSAVARELNVERILQPDDVTCGPTCLRKVYRYYGDPTELANVLGALERNEDGGTLAVFLGIAALKKGYGARIFSYDLRIFDPTWFGLPTKGLTEKIFERFPYMTDEKRLRAAGAYIRFLEMGGELAFDELTPSLLKSIIDREHPVLAGLSATYLYRYSRERWDPHLRKHVDDDIRGEPTGHFVVISGYHNWGRTLTVIDPSEHVPVSNGRISVDSDRLINAILLGDATYDAVLLEVWPKPIASL
ncbi:MAG: hypothetical protein ACT4O1_14815 [Gemmatimonadota bacterium]